MPTYKVKLENLRTNGVEDDAISIFTFIRRRPLTFCIQIFVTMGIHHKTCLLGQTVLEKPCQKGFLLPILASCNLDLLTSDLTPKVECFTPLPHLRNIVHKFKNWKIHNVLKMFTNLVTDERTDKQINRRTNR